jgi:hypothetical protein
MFEPPMFLTATVVEPAPPAGPAGAGVEELPQAAATSATAIVAAISLRNETIGTPPEVGELAVSHRS